MKEDLVDTYRRRFHGLATKAPTHPSSDDTNVMFGDTKASCNHRVAVFGDLTGTVNNHAVVFVWNREGCLCLHVKIVL